MTKESLNSSRTPSDGHLADTNPNSAQTLAASCSQPVLTLSQGAPVSDTASSQTLGQNGPVLLQDVDFIEKLAHFDRERIPERVVHAKGSGAFGTFRPYRSMRDYTSAAFLQDPSVSKARSLHEYQKLCAYLGFFLPHTGKPSSTDVALQ